jgi:hypothetical protein
MKKKAARTTIAALTAALLLMTLLSGCGGKHNAAETAEPALTAAPAGTAAPAEHALTGTWQTASIGFEADGTMAPEYYVQFTDTEVVYGHMRDGEFVSDHADRIARLEQTAAGGFIVQAEASNGVQYSYQTSEGDDTVLEYYETWNESDFPATYSGGASLSRCG